MLLSLMGKVSRFLTVLRLEAKSMQLCWQGGGEQSVALWENTAPPKEVKGGICRSEAERL